jgi:uncharacterized protein YsxB (DUF464 family)
MIVIDRSGGEISINGHAGYAEAGKDIVCAAVSTLAQTLIASIEELTQDTISYDIQPGTVNIKLGNLSEQSKLLVNSFFVGVQMVADNYPGFVRLSKH